MVTKKHPDRWKVSVPIPSLPVGLSHEPTLVLKVVDISDTRIAFSYEIGYDKLYIKIEENEEMMTPFSFEKLFFI